MRSICTIFWVHRTISIEVHWFVDDFVRFVPSRRIFHLSCWTNNHLVPMLKKSAFQWVKINVLAQFNRREIISIISKSMTNFLSHHWREIITQVAAIKMPPIDTPKVCFICFCEEAFYGFLLLLILFHYQFTFFLWFMGMWINYLWFKGGVWFLLLLLICVSRADAS